jgi:hypothetical protein
MRRLRQQLDAEKKIKLEAFGKLDELRMAARDALASGDDSAMHQLAVLCVRARRGFCVSPRPAQV